MARAFVRFVLAFLLIAVHSCLAFPSSIHEKMTRVERSAMFGSADSVPEYKVFPISLPGARRRREDGENINLEIDMYGEKIKLDLKPTRRYLASKNTPVWLAKKDEKAYNKIRYDLLPTAMSDIGTFQMYHDVEHGAAVTVYKDPVEGTVMEGIFDNFYVIRSLPSRLMGELLQVEGYVLKAPDSVNRSVVPDSKDGKAYYAVFKLPTAPIDVKNSSLVDQDNHLREEGARHIREVHKASKPVYPEILIAIDYSIVRGHNLIQVLRSMLAFWNGVDLIYSALENPTIYLNIAGIIIAGDYSTTPYMDRRGVSTQAFAPVSAKDVMSGMGKFFYREKNRFSLNRYDIIMAMTALGTGKKVFDRTVPDCPTEGGQIMTNKFSLGKMKTRWSQRNRKAFCHYFSSRESWCLHYKPLYIIQAAKALSGRWSTLDGQCQNEGYTMACKLENIPTCAAKGCLDSVTRECVQSEQKPLPGTKCGDKKQCSTDNKCA